jgi:Fe-S cluster assembly ATP-binding protein
VDVKEQDQEIVKDLKANKFIKRGVNDDLSGGELKRSELLQLAVQDPELMLLDEPDSGVDLDNCKLLARVIDNWRIKGKSVLLVTHGGNLLKYLSAERAYVMIDGRFSCQGEPKRIFKAISECGYEGCANCLRRRKDG